MRIMPGTDTSSSGSDPIISPFDPAVDVGTIPAPWAEGRAHHPCRLDCLGKHPAWVQNVAAQRRGRMVECKDWLASNAVMHGRHLSLAQGNKYHGFPCTFTAAERMCQSASFQSQLSRRSAACRSRRTTKLLMGPSPSPWKTSRRRWTRCAPTSWRTAAMYG